ncbi:hypothetical protein ANCCAN_20098 [Ancylostoma caninum]|uniref:Uncharacterized protein n=1 Tax=Ancylostoma caninum TaxID=29170 RepID=A0A368FUX2_ANCCA|nr:hypothetical protein ANCCAN_20098 [Ancylostoma caninum]
MKDGDILWAVLRGAPIDDDLWKQLEGIAWKKVLKESYEDKQPQGPNGPAGLEQLKKEYIGYSEAEASWREGRS